MCGLTLIYSTKLCRVLKCEALVTSLSCTKVLFIAMQLHLADLIWLNLIKYCWNFFFAYIYKSSQSNFCDIVFRLSQKLSNTSQKPHVSEKICFGLCAWNMTLFWDSDVFSTFLYVGAWAETVLKSFEMPETAQTFLNLISVFYHTVFS